MSLQSLTSASQSNAESTSFAVEMGAGKLSNDKYQKFLWNMYTLYDIMEDVALSMGCFAPKDPQMPAGDEPLDGLMQADDILADFKELGGDEANPPAVVEAVNEYISHIIKIFNMINKNYLHTFMLTIWEIWKASMLIRFQVVVKCISLATSVYLKKK